MGGGESKTCTKAQSDLQLCTTNLSMAQKAQSTCTTELGAAREIATLSVAQLGQTYSNFQACNVDLGAARSSFSLLSASFENLQASSGKVQSELDACVTNCEKSKNLFYARYKHPSGQPIPKMCETVFNTTPAPYPVAFNGPKCVFSAFLAPDESLGMSDNPACATMQYDGFTYFPCAGPKPDESKVAELVQNNPSYPGLSVV
jgi:hypothetical protein